MLVPLKYANLLLHSINVIRQPENLLGSFKYATIEYEIQNPKMHLLGSKGYYYLLTSKCYSIYTEIEYIPTLWDRSFFNNKTLESNSINIRTGYKITAEYSGFLDLFVNDATFLYFQISDLPRFL